MALSFQWDPIAFRKATRGWRPTAIAVYRQIIDDLHLNDGSLSEAFLFDLWRDHHYDRRTWRKWVQFLIDEGKLRKNAEGDYINGRVAADHARITKRERDTVVQSRDTVVQSRDTVVQKPSKNAKQSSTESTACKVPLQVTGIQDTGIQDNKSNSRQGAPPSGSKSVDPWKPVYDAGKSLLAAYGIKNPGAVITRLKKQSGASAQAFMGALQATGERERADVVEYLQGCLRDNEPEPPPWSAQAHLNALQNIVEERENGRHEGNHAFDWADSGAGTADDAPRTGGLRRLGEVVPGGSG